jgi:RNA polymerase sigma-70 factor (ECF subfamily)
MQSDAEIVRQVLLGDRQAYGRLVERYERLVRASVLRLTRDSHAAEDLAQEAFVFGLEQLPTLRDPARFAPWLLTISRRTAAKALARGRRRPASIGDAIALAACRDCDLSGPSQELVELLDRLPEHEQTVVALRYLNGHSVQEIAAITSRPVGTITKQLSRGCERLRNWLQVEAER